MTKAKISPVKVAKTAKLVKVDVAPKVPVTPMPVAAPTAVKPKKVINSVDNMTLSDLKARRIEIAEQVIASNVHWTENDGQLVSVLDQTDYWKIKEKIDQWK